ncbi:hypothetical protein UlMin_006933 [Ulmus minor]
MCPMRFLLVFFSAVLAGYLAWKTVRSSSETDLIFQDSKLENPLRKGQVFDLKRMVQKSFWVFVDMASGRYLWRNLREMKKEVKS